ncbi:thermonuclease family protein [Agrobacterium rubi]|nr:thermonuclease family protein [Agrobacterium rubi]NTF23061.1 thermonuclease family protein [Agrobacterium rubi]NTF29992.1 thermonuclease family protein [Agrobacterium rubi]
MLSAAVDVVPRSVLSGRVVALDGRTLWFPANKKLVRLSGIDSCGLVQWSFDPKATPVTAPILAPVPCGALAKAWLKRMIGGSIVYCETVAIGKFHGPEGRCSVDNRDLALEMLRVGWAKLSSPGPYVRGYVEAQQAAIAARYGMWGTYLLNMQEWREKALDKTLGRRPHSDINLLGERDSEISPPFLDARRQPMLRDR